MPWGFANLLTSRIDLHPTPSREGSTQPENRRVLSQNEADDTTAAEEPSAPRSRRLTEYLHDSINAMPLRDSTLEERLDAVRRLRGGRTAEPPTEDLGRQSRLTERLRDRLRVRTRQHGDDTT